MTVATLNGGIDASQELIRVSGTPPSSGTYFTIGSEAFVSLGTGPGPTNRDFHEDYVAVKRGLAGTTKATHSNGASLTPYYPDAPGGTGGSISATDGTTTVNPATSLVFPKGTLSDAGGGAAAVALSLFSRTAVLTDAQIKALPTTPVEIIPAPDVNQFIAPIAAWLYLDWTADYDNVGDNGRIGIGPSGSLAPVLGQFGGGELSNLLQDGASHVAVAGIGGRLNAFSSVLTLGQGQIVDEPAFLGVGCEIYAVNDGSATGNFGSGDPANTLSVTVWYGIVTVS